MVSRSWRVAVSIAALALVMTACASPSAPDAATSSPAASTPAATPTPTPTSVVVAPGAMPPIVADGDCSRLITAADFSEISAVTPASDAQVTAIDARGIPSVSNLGGLGCAWGDAAFNVAITVLPESQLGGAATPPSGCRDYCTVDRSIAGYRVLVRLPASADSVSTRAERIAEIVAANAARDARSWARDRTGWWSALDCASLAGAVGDTLARPVAGKAVGYVDQPGPEIRLADAASDVSVCALSADDGSSAIVTSSPGMAWNVPTLEASDPVDLGIAGLRAFRRTPAGDLDGAYAMTDGVNGLGLEAYGPSAELRDGLVGAIARLAQQGFASITSPRA